VKGHEEKAVFYEDSVNKQTLETVEVTEHEFEGVKKHRDMATNVRYLVVFLNVAATIYALRWMWFYYATDPRRRFVPVYHRIYGSEKNYQADFADMLSRNEIPALGRHASQAP
jgi:hypothetical protein